ncbi:hypothetical protein HCU40_07795 [Pseudanabaena biceps]|nr:hypothetical protein [Pseudanabaena biceps]
MNAVALFYVTHGSSDRRSWLALQNILTVARSPIFGDKFPLIGGGCLEGQELSLSQQLAQFATEVIKAGGAEIVILPLFLLEGVHVSADIPEEVTISQNQFTGEIKFRIAPHLGTHPQISEVISQHFYKYAANQAEPASRILVAHGSRREGANQVVENLAHQSQAIAAYWGSEPKIETQIESLLTQNISKIQVLPYFLTEGGITELIAKKIQQYSDRADIQLLPVPLSETQIIDFSLKFI